MRPILDRVSFVKYSTTASTFVVQPEQLPINTAMVGVIITYLTQGLPQQVTNEWDLWSDHIQKVPTNAIDPAGGLPSYVTPDDNVLTWTNFLKTYEMPTVAKIEVDESLTTMKIPLASVLCLLALLPLGLQIKKRKKNIRSIGLLYRIGGDAHRRKCSALPLFKSGRCQTGCPGAEDDRRQCSDRFKQFA